MPRDLSSYNALNYWVDVKYCTLRSFSIQLKFPRGQKIPPDFRDEHAQSWHLKNRSEKDEREKFENFQLSWRILEKKNYQPVKFK